MLLPFNHAPFHSCRRFQSRQPRPTHRPDCLTAQPLELHVARYSRLPVRLLSANCNSENNPSFVIQISAAMCDSYLGGFRVFPFAVRSCAIRGFATCCLVVRGIAIGIASSAATAPIAVKRPLLVDLFVVERQRADRRQRVFGRHDGLRRKRWRLSVGHMQCKQLFL